MSLSRVGLPLVMLVVVAALHALSATCGCSAEKLDRVAEEVLRRTPAVMRRMSNGIVRRTSADGRSTAGMRSTAGIRSTAGMRGTLQSLGDRTHRTWRAVGGTISQRLSRQLTRRQCGLSTPELLDDGERRGLGTAGAGSTARVLLMSGLSASSPCAHGRNACRSRSHLSQIHLRS